MFFISRVLIWYVFLSNLFFHKPSYFCLIDFLKILTDQIFWRFIHSFIHCCIYKLFLTRTLFSNCFVIFINELIFNSYWRRKWQPTPVLLPGKSHELMEEPGRLQSMGSQRVGHDWVNSLSLQQLLISWEYQDLGLYGHFAGAILCLILWSHTKTKLFIKKQKQKRRVSVPWD